MAQAHEVRARLAEAHGLPLDANPITVIKTTGDQILDRPLAEIGGKGLFTKEIEDALLANEIDVAVHSMKDMQTALPDGLAIGAVLPREDVRDAFISLKYKTALPNCRRAPLLEHRRYAARRSCSAYAPRPSGHRFSRQRPNALEEAARRRRRRDIPRRRRIKAPWPC